VEKLLASPRYGEHFADLWCNLVIDEDVVYSYIRQPNVDGFRGWLAAQFNRNRPWDQIVRDMLAAEGPLEQHPEAVFFELNANQSITPQPALLARSTAKLFLGQQIQCAECHDHPFRGVTQQDYWGLAAFFGRLSIAKMEDKKDAAVMVADAPAGFVIKSNNIGDRKVLDEPAIAIPGTAFKQTGVVVRAKLLGAETPALSMDEPLRPVLARWLASAENPLFARAATNRVWSQLMGRGIVMPIDDLDASNVTSHPDLLDLLAREYAAGGFDQKRLIQAIVSTQAYQRSSAIAEGNNDYAALYAHMAVRPLTAETLLASLCTALEVDEKTLFAPEREADKRNREEMNPWDATPRIRFLEQFKTSERNPVSLDHGIPQMLRRLNDPLFQSGGKVTTRLAKEQLSKSAAVEQLYLASLSRRPTPEEQTAAQTYLSQQPDTATGYPRLLWLLFCQSEFVLNH
jgi:hypothetical protein